MDINEIINKKFKTDKGYMYFVHLLKQQYPSIKIDNEKIKELIITEETVNTYMKYLPFVAFSFEDCCFSNIDKIKKGYVI